MKKLFVALVSLTLFFSLYPTVHTSAQHPGQNKGYDVGVKRTANPQYFRSYPVLPGCEVTAKTKKSQRQLTRGYKPMWSPKDTALLMPNKKER